MKNTEIAWAHHTFNPWEGCTKVSPGCAHCYAEARDQRFHGGIHWGRGAPRRRTSIHNWNQPVKWNREAAVAVNEYEGHKWLHGGHARVAEPERPRVFCASLADVFDAEVPAMWRFDLWLLIEQCPFLDWLILTKRPQNIPSMVPAGWVNGWWPKHVWLGTSVENQAAAIARLPHLLAIDAPVRFLSCEPLLGRVNIGQPMVAIDWIICGGESGDDARPMDEAWARSLLDQSRATPGQTFFMKQMGGVGDKRDQLSDLPADLRVREFPSPL